MAPKAAAPAQVRSFLEAINELRQTPFEERPGEPRPSGYYGELLGDSEPLRRASAEAQLRYMRDLFAFARVDPDEADVLEVGSGFGLGLVAAATMGANATGVELVCWQADWARSCLERLPHDLASRTTIHTGTASALPIEDESQDVVLSLEAISHYLDYRPFLAESARVLKPGGVLLISDGNNGLNPLTRRATVRVWASHEVDPRTYVHDGDGWNPWLLAEHRHRIIVAAAPDLPDEVAWQLALNTSGMVRGQIEDAVRRYLSDGLWPASPYRRGTLTVHPEQEMVLERLFNPYRLAREIRSFGFSTRVRGHWAGASGRRAYVFVDRMLASVSRLSMPTARAFRIAGTRT